MKLLTNLFAATLLLANAGNALASTHYADLNSTNATPPYTNWSTAATNIQDAVDAATAGDEVVVTNGTYQAGSREVFGVSNRVAITKPIAVRSVNGPAVTSIVGHGPSGLNAVRCVYLSNGALLAGFTLTNGAAQTSGDYYTNRSGGGVWCESLSAIVSNCVLAGNGNLYAGPVKGDGGGAYSGTLINCTLTGNVAYEGGGASASSLNNCVVSDNTAVDDGSGQKGIGGGAYSSTLNNCNLIGNLGVLQGGGAAYSSLNNCTLAGNSAYYFYGGSALGGMLNNCIRFKNYSGHGSCEDCNSPGSLAGNNWTGDPLFVDTNGWANLRLQSNSPCINAGNNAYAPAGPDLDGNPRIVGGAVDIGAYEYQSLSLINFDVAPNQAGFNITGQSNQIVIVQTSADLTNWYALATNTLSGHPFSFSDPTPTTLPRRFYRAQKQ